MPSFRRAPLRPSAAMQSRTKTFPAPIRGWVQSESLARDNPNGATVLENFFPTTRGIRPRGGLQRHATIDDGVVSLMAWRSGTVERVFATDNDSIYNITSPANPSIQPSADVTGLASGFFSSTMFSTAGGDFLMAVNGSNTARNYNGTTWATTPAITGVTSSTLSYVWSHKNRLFFIQKDTMNAWCLPVDSIGGAVTQISLSGVFTKGGSLLFGATWSVDAGNGMDDICLFVTTKGEIAAFAGSDPADPNDWGSIGRYDIGQPLGPNAHFRAGGDVIIATIDGLVPMSAAKEKDPAALTLAAVTRAIEDEWRRQAVARQSSKVWACVKWIARNMAIIGLPTVGASEKCAYVVNLLTGAWAKYTGWDISCMVEAGNLVYVGTATVPGRIHIAEASGSDDGVAYFSTFVGRYDHFEAPTATKTATMARSSWSYRKPFISRVSCSFDYKARLPAYPNAAQHPSLDTWDVGRWDVALWDAGTAEQITTGWVSVAGQGFAIAPNIQITNSHAASPEAELVSVELLFEMGGTAV